VETGDHKGSWDWLDFTWGPGNGEARYFGAALAAIAVGTAPGYYSPGTDADTDARVMLLRGYLKDGLQSQNLQQPNLGPLASTKLEGILTKPEQKNLIDQLLGQQHDDGGWSLSSLGTWVRSDKHSAGNRLRRLRNRACPACPPDCRRAKGDAKIVKGLAWLKSNQSATGAWPGVSVNKKT